MDRGIWATWYDLPAGSEDEHLDWLHGTYLPRMLARPGYLWAAHVANVDSPEREADIHGRLVHTTDPSIPAGFRYLLLFGSPDPYTFVDPSPDELLADLGAQEREMLDLRIGERSSVFVEIARADGPQAKARRPGLTPGPVLQFGTFNIDAPEHEMEMNTWYSRSRLPLVQPVPGNVGVRRLVSISGWAKHGVLYEFASMEAASGNLRDRQPWTLEVLKHLVHAPHSPTLGTRIWPAVEP